jgi:hypothetical protein
MLKELLYKWFGIDPLPCATCEVLRCQLDESNRERRDLLNRLLEKDKPEPPQIEEKEILPIKSQFVPFAMKRQMLEAEDRRKSQLMKEKEKEIAELEKELEIHV